MRITHQQIADRVGVSRTVVTEALHRTPGARRARAPIPKRAARLGTQRGVPLLLGSIASGQTRVLCHAHTTGGAQYSHAHSYLTSDNRHVVFNSDRTGVPQVCLVRVPDGFLDGLNS